MHIGKALAAAKEGESQMIVLMGSTLYLKSIVINGDPSTEHKGKLTYLDEQVNISKFFYCEGLLLCILKNDSRIVVWDPYLGQPRWVELRYQPYGSNGFSYALGYEDKKSISCRSHKLLRFIDRYCNVPEKQFFWYEIYDFESGLWTTLDVTPHWRISEPGVSLKGNTCWCAAKRNEDIEEVLADCIICFDFTKEKLAVLLQHDESNPYELDIWITTKIETEEVLWSKFLRVETDGFDSYVPFITGSFFIEEEKKLAIGFDDHHRHNVFVIGEAKYLRVLDLGREFDDKESWPNLCSYVPSLVQIKQPAGGEGKQQSDLERRRYDEYMSRLDSLLADW
ncbi:hypothetical protein CARUB_v10016441mg [Capsella rubella]|uniref:F-box associated beta-propeller type 1 domain-containing protein n=1 Tax=Capsella rubella TaxID=81985 RepID=R0I9B3_9BRAS|nr:hypothetical protein CARUB_v10016441mg [Capsella rubella]